MSLENVLADANIGELVTFEHPEFGEITLTSSVDEDGGGLLWGAVDPDELLAAHLRTKVKRYIL